MNAHRLIQAGVLLILLGLLTGLGIPAMTLPRVGLSAHLEGVQNGMLLMLMGLIAPYVQMSERAGKLTCGLLLYGTYINWLSVLLAAIIGAGGELMPIAAGHTAAAAWQEGLIKFGLISLAVAMIASTCLVLWGLRTKSTTASIPN